MIGLVDSTKIEKISEYIESTKIESWSKSGWRII